MHESHSEADEAVNDDHDAAPAETDGLEAVDEAMAPDPADESADGEVLEDVEHEGRTYQVPKALKGAFLMQADYTRKTQELAEERRVLETERALGVEVAQARIALGQLDDEIAAAGRIDWDGLHQQDPAEAERLQRHLQSVFASREELAGRLIAWEERRAIADRQARESNLMSAHAQLSRDLPGWSPELAVRLASFAQEEFGVADEELKQIDDPRLVRLLHAAYVGANAASTGRQAQRHAQAQASRPAATVAGRGSGGKDPNRMTTDEWMRHRNSQIRRAR